MTSRLIMGYSIFAAMAAAGLFALWVFVLREKWVRRGRRIQGRRDKRLVPTPSSNEPRPAYGTD